MTVKSPLLHDQISGVNENQHHNQKHDLSSDKDHFGKLDESKINYHNPPLHSHIGKIKVKKEGLTETKARPLIELKGSGVNVSENSQYDKIIVEIDNSIVDVPAGTPEYYVLSSVGSPSVSTAIWDEPHIKQSLYGTLIGIRPEINFYASGSYLSISAFDNPINDRVDYYIEASGTNPATTVMSETTYGLLAAVGTGSNYAREDHTHGSPVNPITAHEATYNHNNLPTSDQKAALIGSSGTPSATNRYLTEDTLTLVTQTVFTPFGYTLVDETLCDAVAVTKSTVEIVNYTRAVYLGQAQQVFSKVEIVNYVTDPYDVTPAEIGIAVGDLNINDDAKLTRIGYVDATTQFKTLGTNTYVVNLSGLSIGDHMWLCWCANDTAKEDVPAFYRCHNDVLNSGLFVQVKDTLFSTMAADTVFSTINVAPMWAVLKFS